MQCLTATTIDLNRWRLTPLGLVDDESAQPQSFVESRTLAQSVVQLAYIELYCAGAANQVFVKMYGIHWPKDGK